MLAFSWCTCLHLQAQTAGSTTQYSYTDTNGDIGTATWTVTSPQGSIISTSRIKDTQTLIWTYSATVSWNAVGSATVTLKSGTLTIRTWNVTVSCPTMTSSTAYAPNFCGSSGQVTFTGSVGSGGNTIRWYDASSGGTLLATGTNYTTPVISSSTTYYIATYNSTTNCEQSTRAAVTAIVSPLPGVPTSLIPANLCGAGSATLSAAVGSGGVGLQWFSSNGTYLYSGTSYTTPVLSASTTYYVATYNSYSCLSAQVPITATINPVPGNATLSATPTICSGNSIVLSATVGSYGDAIRWYNTSQTFLQQGSSYTTPALSANTTYYASTYNTTTGCEGVKTAVTVTVNPTPGNASISAAPTICSGSATVLSATLGSNGDVIKWYNSSQVFLQQSTSYTTPALSVSTNYYASTYNTTTGCESAKTMVAVTVSPTPGNATISSAPTICSGSATVVSATVGSNGNTIRWYDTATGGTLLAAATNYTTPTLTQTTTYYAESYNSTVGCVAAARTPATVTVTTAPSLPSGIADAVIYGSGSITINAAPQGGDNVKWYTVPTGGTPFYTGTSYSPTLSTPTNYYISSYNSALNCESSVRTPITITVSPLISSSSVITETMRVSGITQDAQIYTLTPQQKNTQVSYVDGLARVHQQISVASSPNGYDVVYPTEYDAQGRTTVSYLPYVANTQSGTFKSSFKAEQLAFYSAANDKVADDTSPFAKANFEDSPLGRPLEQGGVGADWQPVTSPGVSHTQRLKYTFNDAADNVRRFNPDGTSTLYYTANTLYKSEVTDENNNKVIVFTDDLGRTILKKVQHDQTINGVLVNYLETYNIYNDLGQLKYTISPKGVSIMQGNGWQLTTTILNQFVYQYKYDTRGRVIEKKVPGADWEYFGYDDLNRVVLTQDGLLRSTNQWRFVKYDKKQRAVMQGLYKDVTNTTRAMIQTLLDGLYTTTNSTYGVNSWYESRGGALHGYTNQSFPMTNTDAGSTALEIHNVAYFDNYDFDNNSSADYKYDSTKAAGTTSKWKPYGYSTGSRRLILGTTSWLISVTFYDNYGRVIQTQSNNHLSSAVNNFNTVVYDPLEFGKVVQTITNHNAGGTNQTNVAQVPTYDVKGRLLLINHSINGAQGRVLAQYNYNELGQMVKKNLHCTNCGDPAAGQSTTVFAPTIQRSAYSSSEQTLLATQMVVLSTGYSVSSASGSMAARIASAMATLPAGGGQFMQSVDYRYHIKGWLTSINNAQLINDGGVTNNDNNDYFGMELAYNTDAGIGNTPMYNGNISVAKWKSAGAAGVADQRSYKYTYDKTDKLLSAVFQANTGSGWTKESNTLNESMTYDHNGNILSLQRNQKVLNGTTAQTIDNLTYTYGNGNKLTNVVDAASVTDGFKDMDNANTVKEYTYDTLGNLKTDLNKGISNITYNVLNKPQQITFTNGNTIAYAYDAVGTKLTMTSTISGVATTTNYVGGFVYNTNGAISTLNFFSSPEGRVVKNGSNFEYQYTITDHQGNTRVLFTSAPQTTQSVKAGFETANQTSEASNFSNYPTGSHINTVSTNAHAGSNSLYLNGGYSGQVGVAKSYKVYPGDQLSIQAYAKYNTPTGTPSNLNGFATALLSAFNLAAPVQGEVGTASSAINNFGGLEAGGWGDGTTDQSDPKVFVTIVIFDTNYKFLDVAFQQLTTSGSLMSAGYAVKEAGYAFMYVSNEQQYQTDVYFDDITMSYTQGNILQSNEYYPFGLQTANSWTRDNATNNFLANGGTELNSTSQLYDLQYRNYDATLGRFHQIDPLASSFSSYTPYNYAFNNPVLLNDPSGAYAPGVDPNPGAPKDFIPYNADAPLDSRFTAADGSGNSGSSPWDDAKSVKWGSMTHDEYAQKWGLNFYDARRDGPFRQFYRAVIKSIGLIVAQMAYGPSGRMPVSNNNKTASLASQPRYGHGPNNEGGLNGREGKLYFKIEVFNPYKIVLGNIFKKGMQDGLFPNGGYFDNPNITADEWMKFSYDNDNYGVHLEDKGSGAWFFPELDFNVENSDTGISGHIGKTEFSISIIEGTAGNLVFDVSITNSDISYTASKGAVSKHGDAAVRITVSDLSGSAIIGAKPASIGTIRNVSSFSGQPTVLGSGLVW